MFELLTYMVIFFVAFMTALGFGTIMWEVFEEIIDTFRYGDSLDKQLSIYGMIFILGFLAIVAWCFVGYFSQNGVTV